MHVVHTRPESKGLFASSARRYANASVCRYVLTQCCLINCGIPFAEHNIPGFKIPRSTTRHLNAVITIKLCKQSFSNQSKGDIMSHDSGVRTSRLEKFIGFWGSGGSSKPFACTTVVTCILRSGPKVSRKWVLPRIAVTVLIVTCGDAGKSTNKSVLISLSADLRVR